MEETLMVGVCLRCRRKSFFRRPTKAGDESGELCAKCRRVQGGPPLAEPVATLVPDVEGSLEERADHVLVTMKGLGAPGLVVTSKPVVASCCKRMVAMLINRFGKTRCLPCDADLVVARAAAVVLALFFFAACDGGMPFAPAYEGEPECGRSDTLHAIEGEACDQSITVACACDERSSLECTSGRWTYSHVGCSGGLWVSGPGEGC